jgi:hypothetical protein
VTVPSTMFIEMALKAWKEETPETRQWFEQEAQKQLRAAGLRRFQDAGLDSTSSTSYQFEAGYVLGLYVARIMQQGGTVL